MRKGRLAVALLVTLCLLSACDYHEMNYMVHVVGLGIEKTQEGEYKVSVEIVTPEKSSDGAAEPQIVSATGKTALEAISNTRGIVAKRLSFSHCQVILFDEGVAREGIGTLVDSILQFNEIEINTFCMVSAGCTPSEVLATEAITASAQSFELRTALVDALGYRRATRTSLLALHNNFSETGASTILPVAHRIPKGEEAIVDLYGGAVFVSDRMKGQLSQEEALFFLVGMTGVNHQVVSIPTSYGYESAQIADSNVKIDAKPVDGGIEVSFHVELVISSIGNESGDRDVSEMGQAMRAYFQNGILQLAARAWNEMDCDLFRIATMLYKRYPNEKESVAHWEDGVRAGGYAVEILLDLQTDEKLEGM